MKARLYTLEKDPWRLTSYRNDLRDLPDMDAEQAAPVLVKHSTKVTPFVAYTCDNDPEHLYTLPSAYVSEARRTRALRLWAEGHVYEMDSFRLLED